MEYIQSLNIKYWERRREATAPILLQYCEEEEDNVFFLVRTTPRQEEDSDREEEEVFGGFVEGEEAAGAAEVWLCEGAARSSEVWRRKNSQAPVPLQRQYWPYYWAPHHKLTLFVPLLTKYIPTNGWLQITSENFSPLLSFSIPVTIRWSPLCDGKRSF